MLLNKPITDRPIGLITMTKADFKEPTQNALYATGKFTTDECETLSEGIQQYINESGLLDELLRETAEKAYNTEHKTGFSKYWDKVPLSNDPVQYRG